MISEMIRTVIMRAILSVTFASILSVLFKFPTTPLFWITLSLFIIAYGVVDCTKIYDKYNDPDSYTGRTKRL